MKLPAILSLLTLFACGCNNNNAAAKLLSEQKLLKDSANNIYDRIGDDLHKGLYDSAEAKKLHLGAVHARLADIQSSIDSLEAVR